MLGTRDPKDAVAYIRVGLFAHAVLRDLLEIQHSRGSRLPRKDLIDCGIFSLQDLKEPGSQPIRNPLFRSYEAVATLCDVLDEHPAGVTDPDSMIALLQALNSNNPKDRLTAASRGLDFFVRLAKQAAFHTACPHTAVPKGVRALGKQPSGSR